MAWVLGQWVQESFFFMLLYMFKIICNKTLKNKIEKGNKKQSFISLTVLIHSPFFLGIAFYM